MKNKKALLIVDMQKDFCPGGKLPVKQCKEVVSTLNEYIQIFQTKNLPILASRDWHPGETSHFQSGGGKWPPHCVKNSPGAEFHPNLNLPDRAIIISKGMDPDIEGYTCFQGYDKNHISFIKVLNKENIDKIYIGGVATEYCVKSTALDAVEEGFNVNLLEDATEGVDMNPGDIKKAIEEMKKSGVKLVSLIGLHKIREALDYSD